MNKYAVVFEAPLFEGDNWSSYVPDLPGCIGIGSTLEECRESAMISIGMVVDDLRERGLPVPMPSASVELLAAA